MSKKIGQELVQRGLITHGQLKTALNSQLVSGGHLGTCMIELNFLTEEQLGEVLGEILGVRYARPADFGDIPDSVITLVPAKLAEKHRVVPLKIDGKLHAALVNPKDLLAIDELSFATGLPIRPWVAPEVRIACALEHYYGIPRSRRFVILSQVQDLIPASIVGIRPSLVAATPAQPAPSPMIGSPDPQAPYWNRETENDWHQPGPFASEPEAPESVERVAELLCGAENRTMLSAAVLDYAARSLQRCVLFSVKRLQAQVWDWRGIGLAPETATAVDFKVTEEPFFGLLAESSFYRGPVPDDPSTHHFFRELEIDIPAETLIVPAYVEDRLVALLYGDAGETGTIRGDDQEYRRLMAKLEIALHLLVLKQKLHQA